MKIEALTEHTIRFSFGGIKYIKVLEVLRIEWNSTSRFAPSRKIENNRTHNLFVTLTVQRLCLVN